MDSEIRRVRVADGALQPLDPLQKAHAHRPAPGFAGEGFPLQRRKTSFGFFDCDASTAASEMKPPPAESIAEKERHFAMLRTLVCQSPLRVIAVLLSATFFGDGQQRALSMSARAEMKNSQGAMLGSVILTETDGGVRLSGQLKNVPAGTHGLHFHQVGKCDTPDFKSSGDHFNPHSKQHGELNPNGPHAGDLANVTPGAHGYVSLDVVAKNLTLKAGPNSLMGPSGTSLILHAKEDDRRTEPSGNSGDRIACGIVTQ